MSCSGFCLFCPLPCVRSNKKEIKGKQGKTSPNSAQDVEILQKTSVETGLSVPETAHYEVVKGFFGKEKVRRVK